MPKQCTYEGCSYNQFGGKYCRNHQWCRKEKQKFLKRTPLKKVSKNQQLILGEKRKLTKRDREFFFSIWEEREHICFESGEPIYGDPLTLYFHHCLPKSKYPKYRYIEENIIIVSWETHSKAETNIDFVPKIKEYTAFLKRKYLNE